MLVLLVIKFNIRSHETVVEKSHVYEMKARPL